MGGANFQRLAKSEGAGPWFVSSESSSLPNRGRGAEISREGLKFGSSLLHYFIDTSLMQQTCYWQAHNSLSETHTRRNSFLRRHRGYAENTLSKRPLLRPQGQGKQLS